MNLFLCFESRQMLREFRCLVNPSNSYNIFFLSFSSWILFPALNLGWCLENLEVYIVQQYPSSVLLCYFVITITLVIYAGLSDTLIKKIIAHFILMSQIIFFNIDEFDVDEWLDFEIVQPCQTHWAKILLIVFLMLIVLLNQVIFFAHWSLLYYLWTLEFRLVQLNFNFLLFIVSFT